MTKDSNENSTSSSNFRDQILRDLENLKAQRLTTPQTVEPKEEVKASLEFMKEVEQAQQSEVMDSSLPRVAPETAAPLKKKLSFDEVLFDDESSEAFVYQAGSPREVAREEEAKPASSAYEDKQLPQTPQVSLPTDIKEVDPALYDTVERNLAELRELAQSIEAEPGLDSLASPAVEDEPIDLLEEMSVIPEPVLDKDEAINLEETIIAPAPALQIAPEKEEKNKMPARRRTSTKQHKRQERTAKRIVLTVVALTLLFLTATGIVGYSYVKSSLEPVNASATEQIQVEIPEGASTKEIAQILAENDLIKNATIFNYYSKLKSYNNFQSGYYSLTQSMSVDDIAKALQEAGSATAIDPTAGKVLIVEGYTLTQIAEAVTKNSNTENPDDTTPFTAEQFMATVQNQDFINRMVATYPNLFASLPAADSGVTYQLEGYLFPAIYEYNKDTSIEYLVEQMISTMNDRLEPYYAQIAEKGQTVNEILTLASLVEKEGSTDEDRRNIASVFYNRLAAEMPLQSNIAILYAMGQLGQETTLAEDTAIDTSIDSPYNIYWNPGLMPGPVDSPSLSAIEATINPNTTDYYYFVADVTTGTVYYATHIDDHNANVETYVNSHLEN